MGAKIVVDKHFEGGMCENCLSFIRLTVEGIEIYDSDFSIPAYCPYCGVKISDYVTEGCRQ